MELKETCRRDVTIKGKSGWIERAVILSIARRSYILAASHHSIAITLFSIDDKKNKMNEIYSNTKLHKRIASCTNKLVFINDVYVHKNLLYTSCSDFTVLKIKITLHPKAF